MKVHLNIYRTQHGSVIVTSLDMDVSVSNYILVGTAEIEVDAPEVDAAEFIAAEKARKLAYLRAELAKLEAGE